jgi:hypothetical protein
MSTAAAAESTSAPAPAGATRGLFFRLVDCQGAATNLSTVQGRDGGPGIVLTSHFHEGKAPWSSSFTIGDDLHIGDLSTPLFEERAELRCICVKREVPHVYPCSHDLEAPFVPFRRKPDEVL